MATRKEVKNRIASVKNIHKITRAMEMVAAARLRRAEQRIEQLRPYARGIRTLTRRAAEEVGELPQVPLLEQREKVSKVGILLITGDRGLAGAFNTNIIREGMRTAQRVREEGAAPDEVEFTVPGGQTELVVSAHAARFEGGGPSSVVLNSSTGLPSNAAE